MRLNHIELRKSHMSISVFKRPKGRGRTAVAAWLVSLVWVVTLPSYAQPKPLNLSYLIEQASLNHPSIQSARLDTRASAEDLLAIQRQRWPMISAVLEDGASKASEASASRAMRVEQSLWDFGRLSARIAESTAITETSQTRLLLQQQLLALQTVNAWQGLMAAHAKVLVAQATLAKLAGYQAQMQRRIAAEASPAIDLELVQSRSLQTQVELTTAQTAVKTALTKLEQLSGVSGLSGHVDQLEPLPGADTVDHMPALLTNTDWIQAASSHPAVVRARHDFKAAEFRIQTKQAEQWPQIYARVDQPIAGSAGKVTTIVGLRYTPGAGFSSHAEAQALGSRAASLAQGVETAQREVLEALHNDRDEFFNSRQRIEALTRAVSGADKVLESYGRQFTAGRKTWQDLMNAVREVAQNQYALADAHTAMFGAMHRLQIRLGQGIPVLAEDTPK